MVQVTQRRRVYLRPKPSSSADPGGDVLCLATLTRERAGKQADRTAALRGGYNDGCTACALGTPKRALASSTAALPVQ